MQEMDDAIENATISHVDTMGETARRGIFLTKSTVYSKPDTVIFHLFSVVHMITSVRIVSKMEIVMNSAIMRIVSLMVLTAS